MEIRDIIFLSLEAPLQLFIGKKIEEISNSYPIEEYAVATLILLKKKKRQLEKKGIMSAFGKIVYQ